MRLARRPTLNAELCRAASREGTVAHLSGELVRFNLPLKTMEQRLVRPLELVLMRVS